MKKWLALLMFGFAMFFTKPAFALDKEDPLVLYKTPDFSTAVTAEYRDNLNIIEKRPDGWCLIETNNGRFWGFPDGINVQMDYAFEAFDKSIESINPANRRNLPASYSFGPQTVKAVNGGSDWIQIETYLGKKWVPLKGIPYSVNKSFTAYDKPSLVAPPMETFGPQTVRVMSIGTEGWVKIQTYLGQKWIQTYPYERQMTQAFCARNKPSYTNTGCYDFAPQTVYVRGGGENGWVQISSTVYGSLWIAPEGSYITKTNTFAVYDAPLSGKPVAWFAPQPILVVEDSPYSHGWLKVRTYLGDKWIQSAR